MPLLLIFVFTWSILGVIVSFHVEYNSIKKEVKARIKKGIPEEDLVCLEFSVVEYTELNWIKSNEFQYNGQFYDVVNKNFTSNGRIVLKCISDKKEKEFFANLDIQIGNSIDKKQSNGPISILFRVLKSPLIFEILPTKRIENYEVTRRHNFNYTYSVKTFISKLESPPPNKN
jgi:hypothetical protein